MRSSSGQSGNGETTVRFRLLERLALALHDAFSRDARPLTPEEIRDAQTVFGDSIDLAPVRIVTTWIANSPVALGNTIRVGGNGAIHRVTLIHELAHVWQFQTRGPSYISNSVYHQLSSVIRTGSRADAYRLTWEDLAASSIHDLPVEKQAVLMESYFSGLRDARYRCFINEVRGRR